MGQTAYMRTVRSSSYYEERALEVQIIAEETRDPWCRKVLNGIADDYIRLAGQSLDRERRLTPASGGKRSPG